METAQESDFQEIVKVWEASVRATHHFLKEEDIQFFRTLILNEYLKAVDLYCERNEAGSITGFLGVADGKIEMLFIHPTSRGMGIGKKLLRYAVEKLNTTLVDVNEQNTQAVDFYRYMGFAVKVRSEVDGMGKPYPILHMELACGEGKV